MPEATLRQQPLWYGKENFQANQLRFKKEESSAYSSNLFRDNISAENNLHEINKIIEN